MEYNDNSIKEEDLTVDDAEPFEEYIDSDVDASGDDNEYESITIETLETTAKPAIEAVSSISVPNDDEAMTTYECVGRKAGICTTTTNVKTDRVHRKEKQCNVCGLIVERLRDHMNEHPEALDYRCLECPRKYFTQAGLDRHTFVKHTDDR